MNKDNCEIIKDLLPLYEEDLLSEESKSLVINHIKTCDECRKYLNEGFEIDNIEIDVDKIEINKNENIIMNKIKKSQDKIKYILVLFAMILAISNTYISDNILKTIPLIIIIPFILRMLFEESKIILLIGVSINILLTLSQGENYIPIYITTILSLLAMSSAIIFAKEIKNKNKIRLIISFIFISILIFSYEGLYGNPIGYINAKSEINKYINDKYSNSIDLEIYELEYNSKFNGYVAQVCHSVEGTIGSYISYHGKGSISDGYQFQTKNKINEEVNNIITTIISQNTNFEREDLSVESEVNTKEFKYTLVDNYSGKEPINLKIGIGNYNN